MRSARRDALLFFAMALAPSIAIGLLGQRAIKNEGAARERELTVTAAQEASVVARRVQDGVREHAARLEVMTSLDGASNEALYQRASEVTPAFGEPILVGADARLTLPRSPGSATAKTLDPACVASAMELQSLPSKEVRADILRRCEDARDDAGRWLWPVLAFDALLTRPDEPLFDRLIIWLEMHAGRLSPEEVALSRTEGAALETARPGSKIAIDRALASDPARARADERIATGAERLAALRAAVRRAIATPGEPEAFAAEGHLGAVVATGPDTAHGFVVNKESLLRSEATLIVEDARFHAAPVNVRPTDSTRGPEGYTPVTEGLGVHVRLRDPDAVARDRRTTEAVLYGLLTLGVAVAVVLSFALFRRMRETRRTSDLRTSFVAGVSHELRTPLASIRMLSELLAEERVEEAERREVLDALTTETLRLTTTVERFLSYAKSERGKLVAERVAGDLGGVVGDRVAAFRQRLPANVEFRPDDETRAACARVPFDRRQIEILVDNLLENAKKYAPEGEPYQVELAAAGGHVSLVVDDGGSGIERSAEKRIFKAFERGDDRLSAAVDGTGLGLFLVRTIAEAHGGRAGVVRSSRGGARFTVTFPKEHLSEASRGRETDD